MKIILSRKSLDSQYGGIPSPIIKTPDGVEKFFPIPIPRKSDIKYEDLHMYDNFMVVDLLKDIPFKRNGEDSCHLDPDIRRSYLSELKRPREWRRAFGQSRAAQGHLHNCEVGEGDVFLFFGWFKFAELVDKKFRFRNHSDYRNGFHAIYGYLQVGRSYDPKFNKIPDWLGYHPHIKYPDFYSSKRNVIYVASDRFNHNGKTIGKPGSSLFEFSEKLILTQKGQDKRTKWELPMFFHPDNKVEMSYNLEKNWSKNEENSKAILKSANRGQEFVIKKDPKGKIEEWCLSLIRDNKTTE